MRSKYVQRKYDVMHVLYHSTHAQCSPKRLVLTRFPYSELAGKVEQKTYLCPHAARGYRIKLQRQR